jgi:hypothetical protein
VTQVVECLPSKHKAMSSNASIAKQKTKKKEETNSKHEQEIQQFG